MTIVTQLSGGLGNQLFQYAAGRLLSVRLNQPLAADLAWFHNVPVGSTLRTPMLDKLRIALPAMEPARIRAQLNGHARAWWLAWQRPARHLKEKKTFVHDRRLQRVPRTCEFAYLEGYWQSYKYCDPIRQQLLQEVQPARALDPHYQPIAQAIAASESVMLHVRRGDYVSLPSAIQTHGALPLRYYERALAIIAQRVARPELFVFSDDVDWVSRNLKTSLPTTFVRSATGEDAVIDELMLMRSCKHHVIANSSLSWWGAWLSEHAHKTVVAPSWWLAARRFDLRDLIPSQWLIVDAT